jgi:ABC-type lipoprotein export system ATPase subunit
MTSMISLRSISKTYEGARHSPAVHALDIVDLEVEQGEFLVITGRSGSGKTTLLNIAAGLLRPTSGAVFLAGKDLWGMPDKDQSLLRADKIGFVFQFPSLLPSLTSLENVTLPPSFAADRKGSVSARAAELLELVGLADKSGAYPRQLSAGQQQRVVIARALINRPEILFADEPSSDLDELTEREIMTLLKEIHDTTGVTIVMVTHTSELVSYGTRAIEMAAGRIAG